MYYVSTKKKKKKKRLRTRLSEEITTLNVTVTQHRDLAPFLFCALFALRPFCSVPFLLCALFALRPFCSAPFLLCALSPCALFVAPFLLCPFCCALIVHALFATPKCLVSQEMFILQADKKNLLNKRSELVSKCH